MTTFVKNLHPYFNKYKNWPNAQSAISFTCIGSNLISAALKFPINETLGLNGPIRAFSIIYSLYNKRYNKIAFDIPAFVVLLFPNGRLISVIIDVVSEILNFNKRIISQSGAFEIKRLDPNIFVNALKILDVSEERKKDREFIIQQHLNITQELTTKKAKLSGPLTEQIQLLIDDANVAKNTLLNEIR